VLQFLKSHQIDFIVLAGFLWLVPDTILKAYENKIVNIHPALLPKYGGKGMYGRFVHEAVIGAGERKSGITIHRVNQNYDEGDILFQVTCSVDQGETPESLASKIHQLEYEHYPRVVEELLK
jgi:phosphoribosylglycinamide formyltransferase-1